METELDTAYLHNELFACEKQTYVAWIFQFVCILDNRNDIEKAQRKKMKYQFTRYILIAKTTREMAHTKKKKSDNKEFTNDEEELFYEVTYDIYYFISEYCSLKR